MTFWFCQLIAVGLSLFLTRGRRIGRWNRIFWGLLIGIGFWLVWLRIGGGP